MADAPWLSIVTVVKDDPDGFARTAQSVAAQDRDGVEFLVIDSSKDPDIVPGQLATLGFGTVQWTPPAGIYPAMNHGLYGAIGEYVHFLNAGDALDAPSVLSSIRATVAGSSPDWLFGPVRIVGADGRSVITPPWDYRREKSASFSRGLFPPHQGTVARRTLLQSFGGFDTSYLVAADYAAFLRMSLVAEPAVLGIVVAAFAEGGTSTVQWKQSFAEFHRARRDILRPTGTAAMRERYETVAHFARVFAYREVVLRARR